MEVSDLLKIESNKVRCSPDLMLFYIETFKQAFGYAPNCAGCSFGSDWEKLKRHLNKNKDNSLSLNYNFKTETMNFELKRIERKILSYQKDGKTYKRYDNRLYDEFVKDFLVYGTEAEIEERKKLFRVLPEPVIEEPKEDTNTVISEEANLIPVVDPVILPEPVTEEPKEVKKKGRPAKATK